MRFFVITGVLQGALLCTSPLDAQALWPGPSGGGLLMVQEATIATPRHGACGVSFDNYDRDPLGLDIVDLGLACRIGITPRIEFMATYQLARGVVVPGDPPIPPPPIDIFVVSGEVPKAPYRVMYVPMPYLPRGSTSIMDMRDGEYSMGMRALVRRHTGAIPAVTIGIRATMTAAHSLDDLQKGAGAGSTDVGIHGAATWTLGRFSPSVNLGYTHLGNLEYRDRFITAEEAVAPSAERPNLLHTGVGVRFRMTKRSWLIGEFAGWRPVGYRTPTFEQSGAHDVLAGTQMRFGPVTLTAGVRYHHGAPRSDVTKLTGPLGGGILLTDVEPSERTRYLESIGFPDPQLRRGAGTLVIGLSDSVPLPRGARLIPTTFSTDTRHNIGTVVSVSVSF